MLQTLTGWLADPTVRDWYLGFCVTLMIVPMAAVSTWYHIRIRRTPGGRELMARQARSSPSRVKPDLAEGIGMARDIAAGRYGDAAKAMQRKVYWVVGIWVVALTLALGLLFYADEVNRAASP